MRTYDLLVSLSLISLALGLAPAASFDGTPEPAPSASPSSQPSMRNLGRATPLVASPIAPPAGLARPPAAAARIAPTPLEAFRSGTQALRDGRTEQGVTALEFAAVGGVPGAIWKLGRMYAEGDGVDQNKLRAFEYFRNLTKAHAYDPPGTPESRYVASAFVSLGHFYLEGIPDTSVRADPTVAHEMFRYAASYFADPDAQFHLGRLYLLGKGTPKDPIQAARWFRLAGNKGQHSAQALLGSMLFKGQDLSRQAAMGLFWLTVAKDGVAKDGGGPEDSWIAESYASANAQATEDERALAYKYLEDWVRTRKE